jgi:hypothetical protein
MGRKKTAPPRLEKIISDSDRAFIDEYIANGYNATRAYMKVHPKAKYESARALSSKMLTNLNIREAIAKEFEARTMKREEVLGRLSDMARATHYSFIEIDSDGFVYFDFSSEEAKSHLHLIKKIKSTRKRRVVGKGEEAEEWEGEWVEVELHDAKDALKLIGQHEKIFDPEKGDGETFTAPQIVEIIKTYEERKEK